MTSNFVPGGTSTFNAAKLTEILKNVTDAAQFVEQALEAAGKEGTETGRIEALIAAFGNLAVVAIQSAHAVAGKEITPESVIALLPVNTALVSPVKEG